MNRKKKKKNSSSTQGITMNQCKKNTEQVDIGVLTHIPAYSGMLRHDQAFSGIIPEYPAIFRPCVTLAY